MFAHWGAPVDTASWLALAAAVALLGLGRSRFLRWLTVARPWQFATLVAAGAACLSALYVATYLGGAPRIIDATSYFLAAKLGAAGSFSFMPDGPPASFNGRFLVTAPDGRLGPLFPPGYPAVLALFVQLGKPMWLGPMLGGLIAVATYRLGLAWFRDETVARLSALFSLLSAALRYHTADTMSHGWAALLLLIAVLCSTGTSLWTRGACGLALGWLCATRPVTGLLGLVLIAVFWRALHSSISSAQAPVSARPPHPIRWQLLACSLGLIPGLLLLGLQQRSMTGSWFGSLQYTYYARGDAPAGCFRYGFGSRIGCQFEHGPFVAQFLPQGYAWQEALQTTGRRLAAHFCDAANIEVLSLALPFWMWLGRRSQGVRHLTYLILGQVLAYVPFYFDGNYPGGGARFYAEILPYEHLLLGWGVARWKLPQLGLGLSLTGFACHSVHRHLELGGREGGAPMFEERVLKEGGVDHGLIFVDSDHGFNLGYDPRAHPGSGVLVARYRGDASDFLLFEHLGAPPSYRYLFDATGHHAPRLEAYVPSFTSRVSPASLWPPRSTNGGAAIPGVSRCGTHAAGLTLLPDRSSMAVEVDLWVPRRGNYRISWLADGPLEVVGASGITRTRSGACETTTLPNLELDRGPVTLRLATSARVTLGTVEVEAVRGAPRQFQ